MLLEEQWRFLIQLLSIVFIMSDIIASDCIVIDIFVVSQLLVMVEQ